MLRNLLFASLQGAEEQLQNFPQNEEKPLWVFFLGGGEFMGVQILNAYSRLCTQDHSWGYSREHMGCQGLNLGQQCAMQALYLLYYLSVPAPWLFFNSLPCSSRAREVKVRWVPKTLRERNPFSLP